MTAPSLGSRFESVRAGAGRGRGLALQVAPEVPAAVALGRPMLEPRIATLRGIGLQNKMRIRKMSVEIENMQRKRERFLTGDTV